jgi:osmotically-inducible protein OsmY
VDSYWKQSKAEQLVSNLRGVIDVANHLTVTPGDDILDKDIAQSIEKAIERTFYVEAENITVLVENGKIALTGIVPSYYARGRAYEAAALTEGVVKVDNNIIVM